MTTSYELRQDLPDDVPDQYKRPMLDTSVDIGSILADTRAAADLYDHGGSNISPRLLDAVERGILLFI